MSPTRFFGPDNYAALVSSPSLKGAIETSVPFAVFVVPISFVGTWAWLFRFIDCPVKAYFAQSPSFAGRDPGAVRFWADAARTPYYRVWSSTDFEGCEASAALKNAFAIAVGFGAGAWETEQKRAGAGPEPLGVAAHNVEAAVSAEAVAEMSGLVGLAGGDPATPFGLVGVGDLLVTTHARNARLGRLLGSGLTYDRALEEMAGLTLEGVETIKTVGRALEDLDRSGRASPADFPLMRHLGSVIGGTAIRIPFDLFGFGDPRS